MRSRECRRDRRERQNLIALSSSSWSATTNPQSLHDAIAQAWELISLPKSLREKVERFYFAGPVKLASKMVLEAIRYKQGHLQILNQLKLPHQEEYDDIRSAEDGWHAIKEMRTRGAPAIAIVAALSLAVELQSITISDKAEEIAAFIIEKLDYLVTSRPTAVNLADAARKLNKIARLASEKDGANGAAVSKVYCDAAAQMLIDDVSDNEGIGKYGAEWIAKSAGGGPVSVLTHCNTG